VDYFLPDLKYLPCSLMCVAFGVEATVMEIEDGDEIRVF
jgi:hypothetical protein